MESLLLHIHKNKKVLIFTGSPQRAERDIDGVKYGNTGCRVFKRRNQHTQRKILSFENWCNGEVSKSAKI